MVDGSWFYRTWNLCSKCPSGGGSSQVAEFGLRTLGPCQAGERSLELVQQPDHTSVAIRLRALDAGEGVLRQKANGGLQVVANRRGRPRHRRIDQLGERQEAPVQRARHPPVKLAGFR